MAESFTTVIDLKAEAPIEERESLWSRMQGNLMLIKTKQGMAVVSGIFIISIFLILWLLGVFTAKKDPTALVPPAGATGRLSAKQALVARALSSSTQTSENKVLAFIRKHYQKFLVALIALVVSVIASLLLYFYKTRRAQSNLVQEEPVLPPLLEVQREDKRTLFYGLGFGALLLLVILIICLVVMVRRSNSGPPKGRTGEKNGESDRKPEKEKSNDRQSPAGRRPGKRELKAESAVGNDLDDVQTTADTNKEIPMLPANIADQLTAYTEKYQIRILEPIDNHPKKDSHILEIARSDEFKTAFLEVFKIHPLPDFKSSFFRKYDASVPDDGKLLKMEESYLALCSKYNSTPIEYNTCIHSLFFAIEKFESSVKYYRVMAEPIVSREPAQQGIHGIIDFAHQALNAYIMTTEDSRMAIPYNTLVSAKNVNMKDVPIDVEFFRIANAFSYYFKQNSSVKVSDIKTHAPALTERTILAILNAYGLCEERLYERYPLTWMIYFGLKLIDSESAKIFDAMKACPPAVALNKKNSPLEASQLLNIDLEDDINRAADSSMDSSQVKMDAGEVDRLMGSLDSIARTKENAFIPAKKFLLFRNTPPVSVVRGLLSPRGNADTLLSPRAIMNPSEYTTTQRDALNQFESTILDRLKPEFARLETAADVELLMRKIQLSLGRITFWPDASKRRFTIFKVDRSENGCVDQWVDIYRHVFSHSHSIAALKAVCAVLGCKPNSVLKISALINMFDVDLFFEAREYALTCKANPAIHTSLSKLPEYPSRRLLHWVIYFALLIKKRF